MTGLYGPMNRPHPQLRAARRPQTGVLLMGLAALSWGLGVVMTKVALEQLTPLDVLGTELLVGAAVVVAALLARGGGTTVGWRSFALLGLLEPGLSYALGDFGLQRTGAADGAL